MSGDPWGLASLAARTAVCIRIGDKWPDCAGHVFAYFVECVDWKTGTVLVWNLTNGDRFEAPINTAMRQPLTWVRPATSEEEQNAVEDLRMLLGRRLRIVQARGLYRR